MRLWSSRALAYQRLGLSRLFKHAAPSLLLQILLEEGIQIDKFKSWNGLDGQTNVVLLIYLLPALK